MPNIPIRGLCSCHQLGDQSSGLCKSASLLLGRQKFTVRSFPILSQCFSAQNKVVSAKGKRKLILSLQIPPNLC